MKSFVKAISLNLLTITSLGVATINHHQAFAGQTTKSLENSTIYSSQIEQEINQQAVLDKELIAQSFGCEKRWVNGVLMTCCYDSYGN
jgi:hypothetical protein